MSLRLVELDEGFSCYVSGEFEARFIYAEIFQDHNYDHEALPERPVIVDVGANIGLFSLFVKRRYPQASVIAFEPAPENVTALRRNLELHEVDGVAVHPVCLGAQPGEAQLTYYPQMPGNSTLHPGEKELQKSLMSERLGAEQATTLFASAQMTVGVERLSDVLSREHPEVTAVHLLKVDVEGAELDVLRGIDDRHWPHIGTVLLEAADFGDRLEQVTGLLRSKGFDVSAEPVKFMWEELRFHYVTATRKR